MIFKNEAEPRIQKIAADTPVAEKIKPDMPFEYRLELTERDRTLMRNDLNALATEQQIPIYIQLAAYMRYLEISLPKASEKLQQFIRDDVRRELHIWDGTDYSMGSTVMMTAWLLDPQLIENLREENGTGKSAITTITTNLQRRGEKTDSPLSWEELVCLKLAAPEYSPTKLLELRSEWLHQDYAELIDPDLYYNTQKWQKVFVECALARIAGVEDYPTLPWSNVREHCLDQKMVSSLIESAEAIFSARVLNADKVWVEEDGLYIVDPPLELTPKAATPLPQRKHL